MSKEELKTFRELFNKEYPYVALNQVSDEILSEFLEQAYVVKVSISMQLYFCYDWCLAQQQCDVQE